jgi:hypothetical protein
MRSGCDPAIPARIDRRRGSPDLCAPVQKACHSANAVSRPVAVSHARATAAFFGNCRSSPQPLAIASREPVYYNSVCVKLWDRAQGNASDRRHENPDLQR